MDILPKSFFPERTLSRMSIWPNGHCPEELFSRKDTCQNVHLTEWKFPENLFSRIDSCQSVHLMLAIIIQEDEIILFCSVNPVTL